MDHKPADEVWVVADTLPYAGDIDPTLPMNFENGMPASVGLLLMHESPPVEADHSPSCVPGGKTINELGIPEVPSEHDDKKIPPTMVPEESEREKAPQLKKKEQL